MNLKKMGKLFFGCLVAGSMAFGSAQALNVSIGPELLANGCERCIGCPFLTGGKINYAGFCDYCCQVP